jgi:hypothetical protein
VNRSVFLRSSLANVGLESRRVKISAGMLVETVWALGRVRLLALEDTGPSATVPLASVGGGESRLKIFSNLSEAKNSSFEPNVT